MTVFESVRLMEALRSGVSSRKVSMTFTKGRENLLNDIILRDLKNMGQDGTSRGFMFHADYGEGKTHLLNQIFNLAEDLDFVVSLVPLSKDTPFNNLRKVYPTIAANTYLPRSPMAGFEWKLRQLRPDSIKAEAILEFCHEYLHPKLWLVLLNYLHEEDSYNQFRLFMDLIGRFISIPDLKAIHRLNFSESVKIPKFTKDNLIDYFRFLGQFFKQVGYSGWVILFDEAELIGKMGIGSRAKAYCNMYPFLLGEAEPGFEATYTVFAFTSDFRDEIVLGNKEDINNVPLWLNDRQDDLSTINRVKAVLGCIRDNCLPLNPLAENDIREILLRICRLHGEAYGWEPKIDMEQFVHLRQTRLRSKIRAAIFALDLRFLYGQDVNVNIGRLENGSISEDEEFFTKDEDSDSDSD